MFIRSGGLGRAALEAGGVARVLAALAARRCRFGGISTSSGAGKSFVTEDATESPVRSMTSQRRAAAPRARRRPRRADRCCLQPMVASRAASSS